MLLLLLLLSLLARSLLQCADKQTNKAKQSKAKQRNDTFVCLYTLHTALIRPRKIDCNEHTYFTLIHALNHEIVHNKPSTVFPYSIRHSNRILCTYYLRRTENWGRRETAQKKTENNMLLFVNDADCIHLPL